jgi:site-specific DNA recombinase
VSRRRSWAERPQAAALIATAATAEADRGFDAIVVGEYERAFYGEQLTALVPVLAGHSVQVWLPETHGPVHLRDPAHAALVMLLGAQSRREVQRSRFRTIAAMQAQVREQGRHLGGRPPYGYRLVDAGPHPNAVHAAWGRRLRRLDPDPGTPGHVRWIFAQRLAGRSTASIARDLNDRGMPGPSGHDRDRNPHRSGKAWTLRTVAAILANPRYTGRQVWNRQCRDHTVQRGGAGGRSRAQVGRVVQRWNPPDQWIISRRQAHPALISEADFVAAQTINALPLPAGRSA